MQISDWFGMVPSCSEKEKTNPKLEVNHVHDGIYGVRMLTAYFQNSKCGHQTPKGYVSCIITNKGEILPS